MGVAQSCVAFLGLEHQQAARVYATLASAQYDAIKAAQGSSLGLSEDAAAAYASHFVMSVFFNWRQSYIYDPILANQLSNLGVSDSQLPTLKTLLVPMIKEIINKRLCDGSSFFANFKPASDTASPGVFRLAPGQVAVHYPQVANANGFYLSSKEVDAFTARLTHFTLTDPEYAAQLEQTYWLGSKSSTNRSEYDTNSAYFWAQGDGTSTLAGFWINVALDALPESTPLVVQARFLKLLTTSFWDTAVACWRVKYRELFWRPVTAIQTDHGVRAADPAWEPLLTTPIDPEYVSSHMCTSGAALYILETHLGASTPFTSDSLSAPSAGVRSYPNFRAAVLEVGMSRVFAGVHFRKSNEDGMALGYAIARRIHGRFFRNSTLADVY
ncbi:hypothetical protein VOLCADRAFT_127323 [Volvox carteri f. nagariensis]|uniref:Uncharacterized protein n=1 Tax=Volvox carteri f. nagariensis TaxID=3068 RepID=D8THX8_VOLCA|nr:uncharacterized protein VOLCADRAFT_127323 [Volvox carteri f. nagariensis]EFJ52794.1 hypothetical protein VOLCADRAFT_127323 [Volvox carteri f. nagariensis]|eukprot:XP_002945799.1 hypothetical protein VOLCADRAFT_127323 [Volvox carteri f. nagariensis]